MTEPEQSNGQRRLVIVGWPRIMFWVSLAGAVFSTLGSTIWVVATEYATKANPQLVIQNRDGLRLARDSIQVLARETGATDARQDLELTRLGARTAVIDSVFTSVRELNLSFHRFLCREDGNSTAYCERTVR